MTRILLWLLVLDLGIAFGAGLYESRVAVPQWLTGTREVGFRWDAHAAAAADVGRRFWPFVTTVPLTLLTLASLACAWTAPPLLRFWWLVAAFAALGDRVLTFAYFIPTMVVLLRGDVAPEAAARKARQWVRLGVLRHALTLGAWLAALRAFAVLYGNASP